MSLCYRCRCCISSIPTNQFNNRFNQFEWNNAMHFTYSPSQQQQHKRWIKEWALAVKLCPIWCVFQIQAVQAHAQIHEHEHEHAIMLLISLGAHTHITNCGHRFYDLSHIICLGRRRIHRIAAPNNTDEITYTYYISVASHSCWAVEPRCWRLLMWCSLNMPF